MDMIEIEQTVRPHSLSVVVHMYNEEDSVTPLVTQVHEALADYRHLWELVLVNDGSSDNTEQQMRLATKLWGSHVRVIDLQRNFGQTAAMQAGIDAARGEVIVTMDGDLQNDPVDNPRLVKSLLEEDLDLVAGWRKDRKDNLLRKIPSRIADSLIGRIPACHFYGMIGLIFGCLGALGLAYLAFINVFLGHDIGTRPLLLISVLLILMAVQFLTTGVLSEMM